MVSKEKLPQERWADYTARRLEEEGIDLTPYVATDGFGNGLYERIHNNGVWGLHISFSDSLYDFFKTGTKNQPQLKPSLTLEDVLRENVSIWSLDEKGGGSIYFKFEGDRIVVDEVDGNIRGVLGPLDRYVDCMPEDVSDCTKIPKDPRSYPAKDFVEDLVSFAQRELKGKVNVAYRGITKNFEYFQHGNNM